VHWRQARVKRIAAVGRIVVLRHFVERMDQRGLFWPDIEALINAPVSMRAAGDDDYGRPKWIVRGPATDGREIEIVCALDRDERGEWTVFITAYRK
jgi:hypothetical protein